MKHNYYFCFLWCLALLWISTTTPLHAQNAGATIARNIVLETEGTIIPIIPTRDGGVGLLTVGATDQPIILNKISAEGSVVWRKNITRFGDPVYGGSRRVVQVISTSDGGFALLGTYLTPAISNSHFSVVVKFDASGNQTWSKDILIQSGPVPSQPVQIIETRDGGYLVTIDGNLPKIVGGVGVIKLDIVGNISFTRFYDLPGSNSLAMSRVKGVAEMSSGYVLTGTYLPNYATNRTFEGGAIFQLIDYDGNLISAKGFYPTDLEFSDVQYDPFANALLIKTTTSGSTGNGKSVLKTDLAGSVKFRYNLADSFESPLTSAKISIAPYPQDGYLIADSKDGNDFRLIRLDQNGSATSVQRFGGSGRDLLYDIRVLSDSKLLLTGLTNSRDGDLANRTPSPFDERVWLLTLDIPSLLSVPPTTPPTTTPPTGNFALTAPSYDCNTGQLTLNTTGSNGASVEYRIVGNRDWSASNVFTIPAHQRQGTTFTLEARQSGQVVTLGFTSACGTTTPPINTTPTPQPGLFSIAAPTYNCTTGELTIYTAGSPGAPVEYRVVGLRDWSTNNVFSVPSYQREGTVFNLNARLVGGTTFTYVYTTSCGTSTTPLPPTNLGFGRANLDCTTGQLSIDTMGGNGTTIEYKIPGLADWQFSNTFQVPIYQRTGVSFDILLRQSEREFQFSFKTVCPTARVASPEITSQLNAVVLPNPIMGNDLTVEVTGATGQAIDFALSDLSGKVLTTQRAEAISDRHRQTLPAGNLSEGLYLLRVSTQTQSKTVKVLKR